MNLRLAVIRLKSIETKDRLRKYMTDYVSNKVARKFDFLNVSEVPSVLKIALSLGIGKIKGTKDIVENLKQNLTKIANQRPAVSKATKAIANFKVRKHEIIGLRMSIRKRRMLEFLDRLVNLAIPRMKDFRGLSLRSFDRRGNLSMGIPDYSVFPELKFSVDGMDVGMNVGIILSSQSKDSGPYLLQVLNFPLLKR